MTQEEERTRGIWGILDYDADERALAVLEESWADHLRGLRTGYRIRITEGRPRCKGRSLEQVAAELQRLQRELEAGNKSAIMDALLTAADENVPLPYWLADALNAAVGSVLAGKTLHQALGYEDRFPSKPGAAIKSRRDWQRRKEFYVEASYLAATSTTKTEAIETVRAKMGIARTTAWKWYQEQDRIQKDAIAALHPHKRVHKLR